MKISLQHLKHSISKIEYSLLGYLEKDDITLEIQFTKEDPGNGAMVDCLTIRAVKPSKPEDEYTTTMEVEVYPESEKLYPRGSRIESFSIKGKY